jgi:hypothetical protein
MKKRMVLTGIISQAALAAILVFGVVLSGCGDGAGNGNGGIDNTSGTQDGLSYGATAKTDGSKHYLLTVPYNEALAALNKKYGTMEETSSINMKYGSDLSFASGDWVILEIENNQSGVRLVQQVNRKKTGVSWSGGELIPLPGSGIPGNLVGQWYIGDQSNIIIHTFTASTVTTANGSTYPASVEGNTVYVKRDGKVEIYGTYTLDGDTLTFNGGGGITTTLTRTKQ